MPRKEKPKNQPPLKPWGTNNREIPQYVKDELYVSYPYLGKKVRQRMGLMLKVPVFIQDPQVGRRVASLCVQEIDVRLEAGLSDGPTSARIAVVDWDAQTETMTAPVQWDPKSGWFRIPGGEEAWLPERPANRAGNEAAHRAYAEQLARNLHFHQVNVWAIVQRVLEFYQDPQALGRPIPWGFSGNRLIIMPHVGYGNGAYYDPESKSLQFYYYGDAENPRFTCLSHDIVTHETGHAILDGIRPYYGKATSVQTAAFHEFIGDLTAILLALFNDDIRHYLAETTQGDLSSADVLTNLAEEFAEQVEDRPYLRSATNQETMQSVSASLDPHKISQVLTGAMFEILIACARERVRRGEAGVGEGEEGEPAEPRGRTISPAEVLWRTADAFRRTALQPLDLCPPCDIQFVDYTSAVLMNDLLTNPTDPYGYRQIMLDVFHRRGICPCGYQSGQKVPAGCLYAPAFHLPQMKLVYHDIGRISRSRTAAYYFLSDNRAALRIPDAQDVEVVDLYDNHKSGSAAVRLPREVVLEYLWREEVPLNTGASGGLRNKKAALYCGGTLVFDDRGNLLSWFRKPGTQHISPEAAQALHDRQQAWQSSPAEAQRAGLKKLTLHEQAQLEDYQIGLQRIAALQQYHWEVKRRGLVGGEGAPMLALEQDDLIELRIKASLRESDFDAGRD